MAEELTVNEDNLVLTTVDNPYNPKTDYDKWKSWDEDNGYYTSEFIARLIEMEGDIDLDDEMVLNQVTDKVVQEILEHDVTGTYMLV